MDKYYLLQVAYTFDAGPNACLYLLESDVAETLALVNHFFPGKNLKNDIQGMPVPPANPQVFHLIQETSTLLKPLLNLKICS